MEENQTKTSVLMLPWLAHGHISPYLELAKKLADRNFNAYICSTPILLQSIKQKIITQQHKDFIKLVPFHIPPSPELPLHHHTTNGLPPHLMITLKNEYEKASPQFADILTTIRPDLVLYDFNQLWAAEMAVSRGIPAVQFVTGSASLLGYSWFKINNPEKEFPCPEIYLRGYEGQRVRSVSENHVDQMIKEVGVYLRSINKSCDIVMVKSCRDIEGKYFDVVSDLLGKKIVPVGQLVEDYSITDEQSELIEWLDKKEKKSVIFTSFGSEYFLNKEERYEIAKGLELSGMNFIWVIRFNGEEKISVHEALPEGFLERIKDRGVVTEGWAPQSRILNHSSTGGFLSHCGWSSVMESMKFGVPIVALPMHNDQPINARIVEAAGVGVEVVRDEEGKLVSEEITKAIREVMVEESGEGVRNKMKELSHKLKMKNDDEIDILVDEIKELCKNFSNQLP